MNIGEYINERLADVKFYLRGINYNKLDSERAVEGLREEVSDFFNDNEVYRAEVNKLVLAIRYMYIDLKDGDLEFAYTKQQVDDAIFKFELRLKELIKDFKNNILVAFNQKTGYETSIIDTGLNNIKVKIRDRKDKKGDDRLHEMWEINGLREFFVCIYVTMNYIKAKSLKLNSFLDKANIEFDVKSQKYKKALGDYMKLFNERDYEKFIELYEKKTNELFSKTPRARG